MSHNLLINRNMSQQQSHYWGENNESGSQNSPFAMYFSDFCDAYKLRRTFFLGVFKSINCPQCFLCLSRAWE